MTVSLRTHHLLCVLTYVGEGYGPAFVRRFDETVARLAAGEAVAIVEGPDELCRVHLDEAGSSDLHCVEESVRERDIRARRVLEAVLGRLPDVLDAPTVATLRRAFAMGQMRDACTGCPWEDLCLHVARGGYERGRLRPGEA